jgi:hypothetical protein
MDFIDAPFGGEGIEVPLVASTVMTSDWAKWEEYRKQSPVVDAEGNLDITRPQEEIAGFIQSWLYFGLLAVVSGETIDGHNFSTAGKGWPTILDSKLVTSKLVNIRFDELRLPWERCKPIVVSQRLMLFKAGEAVIWVENHFIEQGSDLVDLVLLSVKILIGTIARSYDYARDDKTTGERWMKFRQLWHDVAQRRSDRLKPASRALATKMIETGWCVHQIHKILATFNYQAAYFFARLPRPVSARLEHKLCSKNSCKGWDSKPGDTHARHEIEGCTCSTITVSSVEVANIIRGNQVPLVSIEEDLHGKLSLKLHTMTRYGCSLWNESLQYGAK